LRIDPQILRNGFQILRSDDQALRNAPQILRIDRQGLHIANGFLRLACLNCAQRASAEMRMLMSAALAEWVSAPTEMKSTPARA
jgi:hypothetical protein